MSLKSIFGNIKRFIISWAADIRLYNFGIILWGSSHYKIKGPDMRVILDNLMPGDILLRKYDNYLGSMLIRGFWSHAAIYVGDNTVVHMLGHGITSEDILTFMRADHIMILRPRDKVLLSRIISKAKYFLDQKIDYDYDFNLKDSKQMYCTEFVDVCADGIISASIKGKFIFPDDFPRCKAFDKIWSDVEIDYA